ncbi:MAG: DUF6261 family protein [Marinoscillum sp.]
MIVKLRTSYLLAGELVDTGNAYLKAVSDAGLANDFMLKIVEHEEEGVRSLNEALMTSRRNEHVIPLEQANVHRENLFIAFRDTIDAYKRRTTEPFASAYQKVWRVIELANTRLYRFGYAEQSGRIEAMIMQLEEAGHQSALTTLGVTEVFDELKAAQLAFDALYGQRHANSDRSSSVKEARMEAVPYLRKLLEGLGILELMEPMTHQPLINQVNGITRAIISTARSRKSRHDREELIEEPIGDVEPNVS